MKARSLVILLLLALVSACTPAGNTANNPQTGPGDEPGAKVSSPAPAPVEAAQAVETVDLDVKAAELRVDGAVVWFEPDTGVQRAAYTRYAFDKAEFEKIVGSPKPEQDVTLVIQIVRTEEKTVTPADPNAPSPDGGFRITIHRAKVLRLK